MKSSKFYVLVVLLTSYFTLYTIDVNAWGSTGHRVVAQVAYMHLTKKAHKRVDAVLGKQGMVYWAKWADDLRNDTIYSESKEWHYQDEPTGGLLFEKYDSLLAVLKNNPKDADALKFIVHLTGDRYCPSHRGKQADLGMNLVKVKWFGKETNMHNVWDEGIIDHEGYSYSEYAQMLEDQLGSYRSELEHLTMEEADSQTVQLTHRIYYYQPLWNGNGYQYVYDWQQDLHYQLYAAGIRLAQVLNSIYK